MRLRTFLPGLLLVPLIAGVACSHRVPLEPDAAGNIHRLAVVVRVLRDPEVELEDRLPKGVTPPQLAKKLTAMMTTYELAERIRSALLQRLPRGPPFAELAPTVQVETALGSMLSVDPNSGPPNFNDLRPLGVDGVLYVEIDHWGASLVEEQAALFLLGEGRLFTLDGDRTEWREPIDQRWPGAGLTGDWSAEQTLRTLLIDGSDQVGIQLAVSLGGSKDGLGAPSALDNPDVKIDHRSAEKIQPVLPFVDEVDAGPADAGPQPAPRKGKAPAVVDAGDPLFPDTLPK